MHQFKKDVAYLKLIQGRVDSMTSEQLTRIIVLIEGYASGGSFLDQAERFRQAAKMLRNFCGLDPESHNDICMMAERFEHMVDKLSKLNEHTGY